MKVDFSHVEDVESFVSIPEGTYACRVTDIREGLTRDGHPRWSFRLVVDAGEFAGRTAAWDSVSWSERGMRRAKHVLEMLGFDVQGEIDLESEDLVGRRASALIRFEEREDPVLGTRQIRPRVPYMGYSSLGESGTEEEGANNAQASTSDDVF